jgi:hypothetical protein
MQTTPAKCLRNDRASLRRVLLVEAGEAHRRTHRADARVASRVLHLLKVDS